MADKVYLFDTSSLIAFVRYYLPFDKNGALKKYLLNGFENKEFLLIKEVKDECKLQGLVFEKLPELEKIKSASNNEVIAQKMHNLIDNNFIVSKRLLNQGEYEAKKKEFIQSGDFGLINYAMLDTSKYIIITEESFAQNDGKPFKKSHQFVKCNI